MRERESGKKEKMHGKDGLYEEVKRSVKEQSKMQCNKNAMT